MIGKIVGNYQITSVLARSEKGAVYRGQHLHLPREVVLKSIQITAFSPSKQIQLKARFRREAYIQSQLEHPNIVRMHEFFVADDYYFLVMEYVQGMNLRDLLARQGMPTPSQAVFLFKQALSALDYAHGFNYIDESDNQHTGLIHRDLRPANMLLDTKGRLKITDFGIANILCEKNGPGARPSGKLAGPTPYMSPEQMRGAEIDRRSDLFSLGVALYEMLTSRLPFEKGLYGMDRDNGMALADVEAVPILEIIPELPASLSALVMRAVRRSPSDRFQTAAEFLDALRAYEQQQIANGCNRITNSKIPQQALIVATDPDREPAHSFKQANPNPAKVGNEPLNQLVLQTPTQVISLAQNLLPEATETAEEPELFASLHQTTAKGIVTWVTAGLGGILLLMAGTAVVLFSQQTPTAGQEVASTSESSGQVLASGAGRDPKQSGSDRLPTSAQINSEVSTIKNARLLERQERYDEAIRVYEDYIARNPYASETGAIESRLSQLKMLQSSLVTADAAMGAGKYKLAVQQYSAVLRLKPDSQRAKDGFTNALSKMPEYPPSGPAIARPRPKSPSQAPNPTVQEPVVDPAPPASPEAVPAVRPRTLRSQEKAAVPMLPVVDPPPMPKLPDGEL
jgi:serine/threonine-protein kinase